MRKVYLVLAVLLALAFVSMPAMATVSVKYMPNLTWQPGNRCAVTIYQTYPVGWNVNMIRTAPTSGGSETWPDSSLPVTVMRNVTQSFRVRSTPANFFGYTPENATFAMRPGYDVYVTINPVVNKTAYIPPVYLLK